MGIRKIRLHNRALLAKWLWRFGQEHESLWRKVVVARFGVRSRWESREVRGHHGCGMWNSILAVKSVFWESIRFKLGDGENICFWQDVWLGDCPLWLAFLNIYSLAYDPLARVSNCFNASSRV